MAERHPGLLDELIPNVLTYSDVQKVLQLLLQEKVAIRNLPLILEALIDAAKTNQNVNFLVEKVRAKLRNQICQSLVDGEGILNILTIEPRFEQRLVAGVIDQENDMSLSLEPDVTETLLKSLSMNVEVMMGKRLKPILLCTPILRRQLFLFCERALPQLHVLSLNEIPTTVNVKSVALISERNAEKAA